jgi:leader peptidase (prepilin peptidase)/N-methyltransferase
MTYFIALCVAFFGAALGSFAAVIIYRWPRDISFVCPRSFCPACKKKIKIWHNIPILSWLLLKNRCGFCGVSIGLRALIIEIIMMLACVAIYEQYGLSFAAIDRLIFVFFLLCLAYIDLDTYSLPLSLLVAFLVWAIITTIIYYFYPELYINYNTKYAIYKFSSLIYNRISGALVALIFFSVLNLIATFILRRTKRLSKEQWAMGWGDPILVMIIALFVGLSHLYMLIFLASAMGAVVGIIGKMTKKTTQQCDNIAPDAVPYGPFLAIAGIYVYLF